MRTLPENPDELDNALRVYKMMVKPATTAVSAMYELAGTSPLDPEEKEAGNLAFAALLYQYGAQLDARVMLALWLIGTASPRIVEYVENKRNKKPRVSVQQINELRASNALSGSE